MLSDTGFLASASPALMTVLERLADRVKLESGATLFTQGDPGDTFFAVESGALELSVLSMDGRKLSLCILRQGECLGEISLFDPSERTATATAIEPTELARIQSRDLKQQLASHPELATDMLMLAGRRMRWMSEQISEQALLPLTPRLARRILYLADSETNGDALSMSHARLADFVGATREAVSRTLSEWRDEGAVDLKRGKIIIENRERLEDLSDFPIL